MKTFFSEKKLIIFIGITTVGALLGAEVGLKIYKSEALETVAIGILGVTNLIFIYLLFMSPKSPYIIIERELKIIFPKDFKFFVFSFLLSILIYLSLRYSYDAILYVLKYNL